MRFFEDSAGYPPEKPKNRDKAYSRLNRRVSTKIFVKKALYQLYKNGGQDWQKCLNSFGDPGKKEGEKFFGVGMKIA